MAKIESRYLGVSTQHTHKRWSGATTTATLISAQGTGVSIVPVGFRWAASVAASIFLTQGSGGGSFFRSQFLINFQNQETAWWDTTMTANTSIVIECATDPGIAEFDIWWVVIRGGAGTGALTQ